MTLPPTLQRVLAGHMCAGCGLCAGLDPAIELFRDARGFLRPRARGEPHPDSDRRLAHACPGATVAPWGRAPHRHPLWGPFHRCLVGHATDPELRHTASSGGVVSALALHLLETGRADRVVQVAMDPDRPLETVATTSRDRGGILRAAGSRYAPAAPLAKLRDELATPGRLVFVGKPCDAGALRQLAALDPDIGARFVAILSFFCAATPSQRGTDRIVARLGVDARRIVAFRYRGEGWPGHATARLDDGTEARLNYAESWGAILSKEVQFRCKVCPDAVGGVADVAAADAWYGGDDGYPAFAEAEGRSLILTRTELGDALVHEAEAAGRIATTPLAIDEVEAMQPAQARRRRQVAARMRAIRFTGGFVPAMDGLDLAEAARLEPWLSRLKATLGLVRRIVQGRR
ncbi:MAG: Coenzyme F420 hydrogenase/dehydrogenase, beta subunit C-terminal domain [Sphingomonadaceae bacterium]|uniref:Coenzyme F420 hydrogenase/dehydrogenase, beta subunit C-terminal domain n=1 Tax=Thermaurantiacus sp. TaxID=2820283 RepID=UPI00298F2D41|nr:Coenzyme F420 hydrogenase/dehydrogenase, beta subunit C-terminal domain [Thermaurantiacus sp.]MCS6986101.1 Coenzyme F420 hydrogenase/dehydrogenase, beta subunit C-terminal domain [Sphingomonadaceae bacterium]MDW8414683.1 Coenzyme F420 hydrogenase/dehydrogenase, beta subunit C-terminal domain [Thermaurantiacus sp.]